MHMKRLPSPECMQQLSHHLICFVFNFITKKIYNFVKSTDARLKFGKIFKLYLICGAAEVRTVSFHRDIGQTLSLVFH